MSEPMLRTVAHWVLTLCLIGSLAISAFNLYQITNNPAVAVMAERLGDDLSKSLTREIYDHATQPQIEDRLSKLLAQEPRNWLIIAALEDLATAQKFTLSKPLASDISLARAADHSILQTTGKCLACGWDPAACELSAILLCRAPVDLTPIGDVGGVLRETANYATGQPVDKLDLTLSSVGLGATALAPMTGGSSLSLKLGATAIKTTKKLGNLTPGLSRMLTRSADNAIDWNRLARATPADFTDTFKASINPDAFAPVLRTLEAAGDIRQAQGIPATLHLMKFVDTAEGASSTARISTALGNRTLGAFEMVGKSRLFRAGLRYSDEALAAIVAIMSAIASLALLASSLIANRALKRLRRAT